MAFVNNKGNNQNRVNTTSKVAQLYNAMGEDASTLTLGYWNGYVTVKINPALPANMRQDGKVYDYDTTASIMLNAEQVYSLYQAVLKLEESPESSFSIHVNQYVAKVGPSNQYEGMDGNYYLGLFEVDQQGVQVGSLFFVFDAVQDDSNVLSIDWDENSGNAGGHVYFDPQWNVFKNFLKRASDELILGGSHGSLMQTNILMSKLNNSIDLIKSLIETMIKGGGASSGSGFNSGFSNSQSSNNGGGFRNQRSTRSFNSGTGAARPQRGAVSSGGSSVGGNTSRVNRNSAGTRKAVESVVMDDIADIESQLMGGDLVDIDLDDM